MNCITVMGFEQRAQRTGIFQVRFPRPVYTAVLLAYFQQAYGVQHFLSLDSGNQKSGLAGTWNRDLLWSPQSQGAKVYIRKRLEDADLA